MSDQEDDLQDVVELRRYRQELRRDRAKLIEFLQEDLGLNDLEDAIDLLDFSLKALRNEFERKEKFDSENLEINHDYIR